MNFSVLMSLYNKENPIFLDKALDSIFKQILLANEVILVEDGPLTPELYAVVERYKLEHSELKVVSLAENGGLGKALNEGLKYCSNNIVARMDTDDIAKPQRFERQFRFLSEHPEISLVGSWVDEFENDTDQVLSVRKVPESPEEICEYCKGRCPVNHPTVMYRKLDVLNAGGYLTEYFPEDYFLWIRMLMNGAKFYNIQESLLYFRYSTETIKKRGGWDYAWGEVHIQFKILKLGFISFPLFVKNSLIRFLTRILPLFMRKWIYNKLLRSNPNNT